MAEHHGWREKIYSYAERGDDGSFWAEPLNAWTNAGFWVSAAVFACMLVYSTKPAAEASGPPISKPDRWRLWLLNALLVGIGAGSFCFHTFAERWSARLDVLFIVLWVYWFLWLVGRRVLCWPIPGAALILLGHLGLTIALTSAIGWWRMGYVVTNLAGYLVALYAKRYALPGTRWFWASAGVFSLSIVMAAIDKPLADLLPIGTHFLWHLLNAAALLFASIGLLCVLQEPAHSSPPSAGA